MIEQNAAIDLYLDLLKRSLTATVYDEEPNHDSEDVRSFVAGFVLHYIRGNAVTMLPRVRLDNIRTCIEEILTRGVDGDLIETGVWRGGGCIFMRGCLKAYGALDRNVWVADSFEGLPVPDSSRERERKFHDSPLMQSSYEKMAASLDEVQRNFAAYGLLDDRVRFLRGWFKDTLPGAPIERLALMRLDGDYYESTVDALTALYPKLSPGGFVIIDDYGEDLWTDCRQAVDDYRGKSGITEPMRRVDSKCYFWRKS